MAKQKLLFAAYAESADELQDTKLLAESIRTFGGEHRNSSMRVYHPGNIILDNHRILVDLVLMQVEVCTIDIPEEADRLFYAGKPFAAARAESDMRDKADILVWIDTDTVMLDEPSDFCLEPEISLAYKTVMHNRSGSLFGAAPDEYWRRIYSVLEIEEEQLFPMVTWADHQKIRAYFHAGLLVVRPEKKILGAWADCFRKLYTDKTLAALCRADRVKNVFLHQTALVGAILPRLKREQMTELSDQYNYPVFFDKKYASEIVFDRLDDVVTLRRIVSFGSIDINWERQLSGPEDKISWLKERLG